MKRYLILGAAALSLAGCASGNSNPEYRYVEPAEYVYVVPVDRVVVVTRDVLVTRGWTVYRVEHSGPNRIIWARHGDEKMVRIFANPQGQHVVVRGLWEERDRGNHGKYKGWKSRGEPRDIIAAIDVRLRTRG
jgi:hypothetical protein